MKLLDTLFYLYILGSMILSLYYAPVMFIEQNALVGWIWIFVFMVLLLFLFDDAIRKVHYDKEEQAYWINNTIYRWDASTPVSELRRSHFKRDKSG